jgi:hypothetical protein
MPVTLDASSAKTLLIKDISKGVSQHGFSQHGTDSIFTVVTHKQEPTEKPPTIVAVEGATGWLGLSKRKV